MQQKPSEFSPHGLCSLWLPAQRVSRPLIWNFRIGIRGSRNRNGSRAFIVLLLLELGFLFQLLWQGLLTRCDHSQMEKCLEEVSLSYNWKKKWYWGFKRSTKRSLEWSESAVKYIACLSRLARLKTFKSTININAQMLRELCFRLF